MNFKESWVAFSTIVNKEWRRTIRIWPQTLLPPAITTTLYFVIFGHVIGARIGDMGGYTYMQFIAPGLIMMTIITNSYGGTVSSFFSAKFQRSIEELLVSPMSNHVLLLGFVLGGVMRGFMTGAIVTSVALFFTHLHVHSYCSIIIVALFSSAIFSIAGILNAIFAKKFDDISIVPTFVLTPLTYLGGVFYSVSLLPEFWHYLSLGNPIVYIVNNFRYGFLGTQGTHQFFSYVMMVGFILALYSLAHYFLAKGLGLRE